MAFITDSLSVASITVLKTLNNSTTPKRVPNLFLTVLDDGVGSSSWYRYNSSSSTAESLPSIVAPNDGVGRWHRYGASNNNDSGGGAAPLTVLTTQTPYNASFGERILVCGSNSSPPIEIRIPVEQVYGNEIEIISGGATAKIYRLGNNSQFPPGSANTIQYWVVGIYSGTFYSGGKLIYGSDGTRDTWIAHPAPSSSPSGFFGYENVSADF
ncbi:hypothetical protein [Nostoc punctiforme]|uniref:Uncharacterized protein n=2 Tax=Nostoc punctiforme TaxID=272131 RepID=B2ITA1_NOSP7|nr:hypothetical protein [Nostoc punctiforme]ACC81132.1 hypothetical protein Npun_R2578 [Nostoc punctiforme PCC 73102]RCJ29179.1 hypothetical protein A6769_35890 [Nostoc punctiforme NIES-2108]